jgi:hypothetical protein
MRVVDRNALEAGRQFERQVAKLMGADLVPNSGACWWAKLDLGRHKLVFSLKWTGKKTFTLTKGLLDEVRAALVAPGGLGADWTGGWIVEVDGQALAIMRVEDLIELLRDDARVFSPSRSRERRMRANRKLLFDE